MEAHDWTRSFRKLYDKAVNLYRDGIHDLDTYFSPEEVAELASIGIKPINVYDYAEDFVKYGEPGWDTVLLVAAARRDYFLYEQHSKRNENVTLSTELPPKTEALEGIAWLPRITAKARCFLEGGLCHEIMYGCSGDRKFLKDHDLHPADFLRAVWASKGEPARVLEFVRKAGK